MYLLTKRIFILLVTILLLQQKLEAQTYWMQSAGGQTIDQGLDVSVDGAGNTYVTGYFTSSAAFGSTTLSSSGIDDMFIAKLGVNGLYNWAVKGGGINSDRALSIKSDAAGNSYVTGFFYGTATFGPNTITSAGAQDVFIAKYNTAGTCLWAKSAGGSGADIGNGITVDNAGNVIVTGEFAGNSSFGSTTLTSMNGSTDVFTTKLDANGNFLWTKQGAASLTDRGIDVDCDAAGNIYVTGQFSDTITFDVVHLNTMLNAVYVVKYNAAGTEQWFRTIGGGAVNFANSIACDNAGGIYLTGDFQGTISFFGATTTTLNATYANRIFIAKYDASGGLTWNLAESSDSPLSSKSISCNGSNVFIGGNFKCTFDSYSARYGAGLFNSSGYWDIFEGKYTSAGTWVMGRQLGGKQDQLCNGIAVDPAGNPHMAGSYNYSLVTPTTPAFYGFSLYPGYAIAATDSIVPQGQNCSDPNYGNYATAASAGNSDIFVGNPIDPARAPYDYYYRTGSGCSTDFVGTCINLYTGLDFLCGGDTVDFCQQGQLYASTNTSFFNPPSSGTGPDFTYHWSNNATTPFTNVSTSGYYSVVITTADGCYSSEDTIYAAIHPSPPTPWISDNVVINTNAPAPQEIHICADSVLLVGGNFANGSSVYWQGPAFYPNAVQNDSAMVDSSGAYVFIVTDVFGCSVSNHVDVILDHPLVPIDPAMICLEDPDFNDTITTCENVMLTLFPYDTLGNPTANYQCIDGLTQVLWTVTPASATIFPTSDCNTNFALTYLTVHDTGWYTITETIIRTTACGNDTTIGTHSFYIIVLPAPPPGSLVLTISPNVLLCPGDSALLVVSGGTTYIWNTLATNDSIVVYNPGNYFVNGTSTVSNSYGCSTLSSATAVVNVSYTPQPLILMNPVDGLICPGDSVQLTVSGNGIFSWQGPNGPLGGNGNTLYVNSPGTYYCIETTTDSCTLLSNSVVIQQYNTPQLQAMPSGILCPGDTIVISLTASSGSAVTWNAPLSGNSLTQTITTPGVYSCTVLACNLATTVAITIVSTSVSADITPLTTTTICVGDSVLLGANAGMATYNWQPGGSTDTSIYVYTDGWYYLTTADSGSCLAQDSFQVNFTPNTLTSPFGDDTTVCIGTQVTLIASGAPTLTWYDAPGGNVLATGPVLQVGGVTATTVFYVLTNDGICRSQPEPVTVYAQDCSPQIPNVFTPNGDGTNDVFTIYMPYATDMHVEIYDRWGVLVHEWDGLDGYWDGTYMNNGKKVVDGVYYYIVRVADLNQWWTSQSGFIQLIRAGGN
ncbi:MAG: gliding motility-associated C-terminal domain-containing protein [Bacteroidia bacterium]